MFSEDFLLHAKKWTRWERQWVKIVVPKPLTRSLQSSDYMKPNTSHYGYEITNQYKVHQSGSIFEEKCIQPSVNHGLEKQKDPSN